MKTSIAQTAIAAQVLRLTGEHATVEHRFHPERKWRLDIAFTRAMVGVEIHGSIWTGGRHTRGKGFAADREKMNAAQVLGWLVLEYSTDRIQREFGAVCDEIAMVVRTRLLEGVKHA